MAKIKVTNPIIVQFTPEAFEKVIQSVHVTKMCYGAVALADTKVTSCIIDAILNKKESVLITDKDV